MTGRTRLLQDNGYFQKIDSQGMMELLCEFPLQCEYAWALGESFPLRSFSFQNILFAGMGGSAIGGDLVRSLLEEEVPFPIFVNRAYHLPAFVNSKSLVFAISYSGNTEETLAAYQAARQKKARLITISSGGKLRKLAEQDNVPHILLPSGLPPRAALGYLFFAPYLVLRRLLRFPLKRSEFQEMLRTLNRLRESEIGPDVPLSRNPAKKIAARLYGNLPAIHGSVQHVDTVVMRWRTQLAENSKQLSWIHFYPELNHNEIVGWQEPKSLFKHLVILLLRDVGDHKRIQRRMMITQSLIQREAGVDTLEVRSSGRGLLARLFSLIYVGDFVSFYLAMLNRVDPTPVERIERLKRKLVKP